MTNLVLTKSGGVHSQFFISFTQGPGMQPTGRKSFANEIEVKAFLTDIVKLPDDDINRLLADVRGYPSTRTTVRENLPYDEKDIFQMVR